MLRAFNALIILVLPFFSGGGRALRWQRKVRKRTTRSARCGS